MQTRNIKVGMIQSEKQIAYRMHWIVSEAELKNTM